MASDLMEEAGEGWSWMDPPAHFGDVAIEVRAVPRKKQFPAEPFQHGSA